MKTTYLRSRAQKNTRDRRMRIVLAVLLISFVLLLARPLLAGTLIRFVAMPVWYLEDSVSWMLEPVFRPFVSRALLLEEINRLELRTEHLETEIRSRKIALEALVEYKSIFPEAPTGILATVISRPPRSPYDTILVSAGERSGVVAGDKVFTSPHVAIGVVDEVFETSSRVVLYSSANKETEGYMDNDAGSVLLKGQGGGSMLIELSRAFEVATDTTITLPDRTTVVGVVDHVSGDDTDPFQRVLVALPVNIQNISWVELRHSE